MLGSGLASSVDPLHQLCLQKHIDYQDLIASKNNLQTCFRLESQFKLNELETWLLYHNQLVKYFELSIPCVDLVHVFKFYLKNFQPSKLTGIVTPHMIQEITDATKNEGKFIHDLWRVSYPERFVGGSLLDRSTTKKFQQLVDFRLKIKNDGIQGLPNLHGAAIGGISSAGAPILALGQTSDSASLDELFTQDEIELLERELSEPNL